MNHIQSQTMQMAKDYSLNADPMTRFADIASEIGELGKELVKSSNYGTQPVVVTDGIKMEFGDVLFCLALFANEMGVDMDECFKMTQAKMKQRFDKKGYISSDN